MKPEVRTRSRAVICHVLSEIAGETRVLLMRRVGVPLDGEWCSVAGRIEEGETAWAAALRELKEEAGLVPEAFYSADVCEQVYSHEFDSIMLMPVFVARVASDAAVMLNEEHSEFAWVTCKEAEERLPYPSQRHTLRRVWYDFVEHEPAPLLRIPHQIPA